MLRITITTKAYSRRRFQAASREVRAAEEEVLQPIGDALPLGHQSVGHPVRRGLGIGIVVVTVVVMGAGAGMA